MGRKMRSMLPLVSQSDALFAGERLNNQTLTGLSYEHCTFANISFKDAELSRVQFRDCTFISCYLRGAKLVDCTFRASRFIDCDLGKVDIRTCDLRYYNHFSGCFLPYDVIRDSLPAERNLCAHLSFNLADEARLTGALKDAGRFRQVGARAREEHLFAAVRGANTYYKEKYRGTNWWGALFDLVGSRTRGWLWGYRRSFLVVLRNWALLTLLLFPIPLWLLRGDIYVDDNRRPGLLDVWLGSANNMLPGAGVADVQYLSVAARSVAFLEILTGLVLVGLTASLLFRAVFERLR